MEHADSFCTAIDPIVTQIEDFALDILRQLLPTQAERIERDLPDDLPGVQPALQLPSASSASNVVFDFDRAHYSVADADRARRVPLTPAQAVHWGRILTVVTTAHHLALTRRSMTKRALFYSDVALFAQQDASDRALDEAARLLGAPRHALAITNARKGAFVAGVDITFRFRGGSLSADAGDGGSVEHAAAGAVTHVPAFPELIDGIAAGPREPEWLLVVEKEAVFARLAEDGAAAGWPELGVGPGLVLTGRGYPDVSTRALLRALAAAFPRAAALCLVDHDPHGLQIAAVYAHGSLARAAEAASLALPRLRLLGLRAEDAATVASEALLPLSPNHAHLAECMLAREPFCSVRPDWREELQKMLASETVCEIEALYTLGLGHLASEWLPLRVQRALVAEAGQA